MTLKKFFVSNLPARQKKETHTADDSPAKSSHIDVENIVDVIVKNPEIVLLEDQHDSNSNCIVLNVR